MQVPSLPSVRIILSTEREAPSIHPQVPESHHQKPWTATEETLGSGARGELNRGMRAINPPTHNNQNATSSQTICTAEARRCNSAQRCDECSLSDCSLINPAKSMPPRPRQDSGGQVRTVELGVVLLASQPVSFPHHFNSFSYPLVPLSFFLLEQSILNLLTQGLNLHSSIHHAQTLGSSH